MQGADSLISDRKIMRELFRNRNLLIFREVSKRKIFNDSEIFMNIPCIEMMQVPTSECCSFVGDSTVSRSRYKLPSILNDSTTGPLIKVFNINNTKQFTKTTVSSYQNIVRLKGKRIKGYFWIYNGHLYLSDQFIDQVNISIIIDKPSTGSGCCRRGDCPENPLKQELASGYLEKVMLDMTKESIIKTYKQTVQDISSNMVEESK